MLRQTGNSGKKNPFRDLFKRLSEWSRFGGKYVQLRLGRILSRKRRILIVPGDPYTLLGSCGDQAMLASIRDTILERDPSAYLGVLVDGKKAAAKAAAFGFHPLNFWELGAKNRKMKSLISCFDCLMVVGADVMDGHYSEKQSLKFWSLADQAARQGLCSVILGCSFNGSAGEGLLKGIADTSEKIHVCLRDPVSFQRFDRRFPGRGLLTADLAFLLKPAAACQSLRKSYEWLEKRKQSGEIIVGFNINPHLFLNTSGKGPSELINASCAAIGRVAVSSGVSFLLIPHDLRDACKDEDYLAEIESRLKPQLGDRIHCVRGRPDAADIKSLVGYTDAVITGRMHLAIAALGRGVPVAAIIYQGKFEGLAEHFGLPERLLIPLAMACDDGDLEALMLNLLTERMELKSLIKGKLPRILELSGRNFSIYLGTGKSER